MCGKGAGKTHTMMGNTRVDESQGNSTEAGIIPNAMNDVFKIISAKRSTALPGQSWRVIVSFMEVYNEQVYDLLEATDKILSVREDTERGVVEVAGRTKTEVSSAEEVLSLLQLGNANRKTEATMANQVSSRSHAVLQLAVECSSRNSSGQETVLCSTLSMIDLAGSERASATNNRGSRLQEGANINKSLLALANCINALAGNSASGKQLNVKYRDSKLTHLLKSSLQGKCKLVMIANINPSHITFEDSHNSLKYANRAKNIKVNPLVVSEVGRDSTWVEREMRLKAENAELRARVLELEATVSALQEAQVETDEVVSCSLDSSLLNASAAANDVSLPSIADIPAIKPSKTPQTSSSVNKKTPFSERQRQLCGESREELVDFVEANCSLLSSSSGTPLDAGSRQRACKAAGGMKRAPSHAEQREPGACKRVKLQPVSAVPASSSLKDRIAELSKITLEQQKMFDDILQDQTFAEHLQEDGGQAGEVTPAPPLSASEKTSRPLLRESPQNVREVVSLVDIVMEEAPPDDDMPLIFSDEQQEEELPVDKVPRKRRRNSLIPKPPPKPTDQPEKNPLRDRSNNTRSPSKSEPGGLMAKVLKKMPMTRASKRRMSTSVAVADSENQPLAAASEKDRAGERRSARTRRSSTSARAPSHCALRGL